MYSRNQRTSRGRTIIDRGVTNISLRRGIHDISDLETFHGLILLSNFLIQTIHLSDTATAVSASDGLDMTSSLLGTSVISILRKFLFSPISHNHNRTL